MLATAQILVHVILSAMTRADQGVGILDRRDFTATQSSTEWGGVASRAIDGDTNGKFNSGK